VPYLFRTTAQAVGPDARQSRRGLGRAGRHDIEASFYYPSTTSDFPRCFEVATIVCYSNCRRDKTDLALPDWVYELVQGAGYGCFREGSHDDAPPLDAEHRSRQRLGAITKSNAAAR
jgi:hypothetical protein